MQAERLIMQKEIIRLQITKYWPLYGLVNNTDYIRQCDVCQNRITQRKTKLPLQITDTPDVVWQNCGMDIVGTLT